MTKSRAITIDIRRKLWSHHYYKSGFCLDWIHAEVLNGIESHFSDDVFRCIFVNEKFCILIKISLKFVPKGPIVNNPALV